MGKVREGDDCFAGNSQHIEQEHIRRFHRLQGTCHDHGIEAIISEARKAVIQVLFNDRQTFGDTIIDFFFVNLKPIASDAAMLLQVCKQLTIATA